jgi:phosphoglucomutase
MCCFGGEESAGASILRHNGSVLQVQIAQRPKIQCLLESAVQPLNVF